jgi:hypothetical protein
VIFMLSKIISNFDEVPQLVNKELLLGEKVVRKLIPNISGERKETKITLAIGKLDPLADFVQELLKRVKDKKIKEFNLMKIDLTELDYIQSNDIVALRKIKRSLEAFNKELIIIIKYGSAIHRSGLPSTLEKLFTFEITGAPEKYEWPSST